MKSLFAAVAAIACLAAVAPKPADARILFKAVRVVYNVDTGDIRKPGKADQSRATSPDGRLRIADRKKEVLVTMVMVDLRTHRIEPFRAPSGRMTALQAAKHLDANVHKGKVLAVINGGFFDSDDPDGRSLSRIVSPRFSLKELPRTVSANSWKAFQTRSELWIRPTGNGQSVSIARAWDPMGLDPKFNSRRHGYFRTIPADAWVLGGGGQLLPAPAAPPTPNPDPDWSSRRARTVVAFDSKFPNEFAVFTFEEQVGGKHGVKVAQIRGLLQKFGADRALCFDGGGSTSVVISLKTGGFRSIVANEYDKSTKKTIQRRVKTFLVVRRK